MSSGAPAPAWSTSSQPSGSSAGSSRSTIWLRVAVRRQRQRVRVGDHGCVSTCPVRGHVDLDLEQVVLAVPRGVAGDRPHAARRRVIAIVGRRSAMVESSNRCSVDRLRGRRPQRGSSACRRAQATPELGVGREQVVEHAGDLQPGGVDARTAVRLATTAIWPRRISGTSGEVAGGERRASGRPARCGHPSTPGGNVPRGVERRSQSPPVMPASSSARPPLGEWHSE